MASRALSNSANSLSPREQCGDNHRCGSANNDLDLLAERDNESRSGAAARGTSLQTRNLLESPWIAAGRGLRTGFSYARPSGGLRRRHVGRPPVAHDGVATSKFQESGPLILLCAALRGEISALLSNTSHLLLIFYYYFRKICGQERTENVKKDTPHVRADRLSRP